MSIVLNHVTKVDLIIIKEEINFKEGMGFLKLLFIIGYANSSHSIINFVETDYFNDMTYYDIYLIECTTGSKFEKLQFS